MVFFFLPVGPRRAARRARPRIIRRFPRSVVRERRKRVIGNGSVVSSTVRATTCSPIVRASVPYLLPSFRPGRERVVARKHLSDVSEGTREQPDPRPNHGSRPNQRHRSPGDTLWLRATTNRRENRANTVNRPVRDRQKGSLRASTLRVVLDNECRRSVRDAHTDPRG